MVLTVDEVSKVVKALIRCQIDLSQGMNAFLCNDLKGGNTNFAAVLTSLGTIMKETND